jgi:hypothetical protein
MLYVLFLFRTQYDGFVKMPYHDENENYYRMFSPGTQVSLAFKNNMFVD